MLLDAAGTDHPEFLSGDLEELLKDVGVEKVKGEDLGELLVPRIGHLMELASMGRQAALRNGFKITFVVARVAESKPAQAMRPFMRDVGGVVAIASQPPVLG